MRSGGDRLLVDLLVRHLPVGDDHEDVIGVLLPADLHGFLDQWHEVRGTRADDPRCRLIVDTQHLWKSSLENV